VNFAHAATRAAVYRRACASSAIPRESLLVPRRRARGAESLRAHSTYLGGRVKPPSEQGEGCAHEPRANDACTGRADMQKGREPPVFPEARVVAVRLISRVLSRRSYPTHLDGGSGRTFRRGRPFLWATRCRGAQAVYPPPSAGPASSGSCLTLHAVRFALPPPSPEERWALTPPFHPCLSPGSPPRSGGVPKAIGGLFSVALSLARWPAGGWALPTTVSCRARTFLRPGCPEPAAALPH